MSNRHTGRKYRGHAILTTDHPRCPYAVHTLDSMSYLGIFLVALPTIAACKREIRTLTPRVGDTVAFRAAYAPPGFRECGPLKIVHVGDTYVDLREEILGRSPAYVTARRSHVVAS